MGSVSKGFKQRDINNIAKKKRVIFGIGDIFVFYSDCSLLQDNMPAVENKDRLHTNDGDAGVE